MEIISKPLKDMSKPFGNLFRAATFTAEEQTPTTCLIATHDSEGVQTNKKVYILDEQAYKYFLSKCTEDEVWDLGWLGQSEKHAKRSQMPQKLVEQLKKKL